MFVSERALPRPSLDLVGLCSALGPGADAVGMWWVEMRHLSCTEYNRIKITSEEGRCYEM